VLASETDVRPEGKARTVILPRLRYQLLGKLRGAIYDLGSSYLPAAGPDWRDLFDSGPNGLALPLRFSAAFYVCGQADGG
jgi:hypothetical protein